MSSSFAMDQSMAISPSRWRRRVIVANYAVFLFPSRHSIVARYLRSPRGVGQYEAHHLQVEPVQGGIRVMPLEGPGADRDFTFDPIPGAEVRGHGSMVVGRLVTARPLPTARRG